MAVRSSFFNSINGDRRYLAHRYAEYFASFIGNGVFPNPSTGLQVYADSSNMTVKVKPGKGWINGYFLVNDADYMLSIENADGVLKRIDRIVLRLDFLNREIVPVIKKGAFASNPVAPTLQRDTDAYELGLADVLISNGVTSITQASITDLRLNTSLCGIVHGVVDQVDTSTLFTQYQSWFNAYSLTKSAEFEAWKLGEEEDFQIWKTSEEQDFDIWSAQQRADFDAWYLNIQNILDENVAANLQAQIEQLESDFGTLGPIIDEHKAEAMPHQFIDSTDLKTYKYGFKTNEAKDGLVFVYEEVL